MRNIKIVHLIAVVALWGLLAGIAQAQSTPPSVWTNKTIMGSDSRIQAMAATSQLVFAAGYKALPSQIGCVRCFDAQTGYLEWEAMFGEQFEGAWASSLTLSASGEELFVTGGWYDNDTWIDMVLAYDVETGGLLWEAPQAGHLMSDIYFKNIVCAGDKLFTGCTLQESGLSWWEIKAYQVPQGSAPVPTPPPAPQPPAPLPPAPSPPPPFRGG